MSVRGLLLQAGPVLMCRDSILLCHGRGIIASRHGSQCLERKGSKICSYRDDVNLRLLKNPSMISFSFLSPALVYFSFTTEWLYRTLSCCTCTAYSIVEYGCWYMLYDIGERSKDLPAAHRQGISSPITPWRCWCCAICKT